MLANCWRRIELAYILNNFFTNFFVSTSKLITDTWTIGKLKALKAKKARRGEVNNWQARNGNCQPNKTCALFHMIYIICVRLQKMVALVKMNVRLLLNLSEVHNCLAMWDISSTAYKDARNKQKKIKDLADKLGFIQTFLLLHCFLFLLFSSSVSLFYVSATALSQPAQWIFLNYKLSMSMISCNFWQRLSR